VTIGPVLDWSIVVDVPEPYVCVRTHAAWYHLLTPSQAYEPLFMIVLFCARLCRFAAVAAASRPDCTLDQLLLLVCKDLMISYQYHKGLLCYVQVRRSLFLSLFRCCCCCLFAFFGCIGRLSLSVQVLLSISILKPEHGCTGPFQGCTRCSVQRRSYHAPCSAARDATACKLHGRHRCGL
jgi:Cytosine specific DNA methyltransferase replication foci domain